MNKLERITGGGSNGNTGLIGSSLRSTGPRDGLPLCEGPMVADIPAAPCASPARPPVAADAFPSPSQHRLNPKPFNIGPATIGDGYPVYMIAEAGVNHDGQISLARELIHAAAEAGADAVKFQVFAADRLVTRNAAAAQYQQGAVQVRTQYEMLKDLELTWDQFAELAAYARYHDIEFLATPFSVQDLDFLCSIGVRVLKLASPDIVNVPLVEAAIATGLPVIASTGAADLDEVSGTVGRFERPQAGPLALLHCVSSYPTPESEANLAAIRVLSRSFGCISGFSDHTESLSIGGFAVAAGARIIEKHLTMDPGRRGPDHSFSLDPEGMATYIRNIRRAETLMGDGAVRVSERQKEVRELARRSVVALCDIQPGEIITRQMLTVKRPGGGIPPAMLETLVGRRATSPIAADTPLDWTAVE